MKVTVAQLNYTTGDLDRNTLKIIDCINEARDQGAELVVFPEYAISGSPAYDLYRAMPFIEACEEALVEIASVCDNISVLVGMPLQHGSKVHSAAAFIQNRHIVGYITKKNVVSRYEMGFIDPGNGPEIVKVNGNKIAVVLGDDIMGLPDPGNRADILVSLHADPYARAVIEARYIYCGKLAFQTNKPLIFVNQLGGHNDVVFDGSSFVHDREGKPVVMLKNFGEDVAVVDTDSTGHTEIPEQNKTRNVYMAIKLGLKDYFRKNGFRKACVGVSGGIDSAVVLALAAEVLGKRNVRALMLPSQFSSDHSVEDAVKLAVNLGVEYNVVPITETYKAVVETMIPVLGGTAFDTTEENVQARIRTVMLMALSNKFGHILLNTGNKSENAVGYSTLYGDMAGSFSILGDLYKSEVYDLARFLNRSGEVIPENILAKEPSAELRPDQKDSDSLPLYDILDAILYRFIEEGQSVEEIVNAGFDDATVRLVLEMIKHTEYKRVQGCPVLRLSTKPFDPYFKLPLTNKFLL